MCVHLLVCHLLLQRLPEPHSRAREPATGTNPSPGSSGLDLAAPCCSILGLLDSHMRDRTGRQRKGTLPRGMGGREGNPYTGQGHKEAEIKGKEKNKPMIAER